MATCFVMGIRCKNTCMSFQCAIPNSIAGKARITCGASVKAQVMNLIPHWLEVVKKLVAISQTHWSITEIADVVQNLNKSLMDELRILGEAEKTLINTTSCDGAAISMIQAVISLIASLNEKEKNTQSLPKMEHVAALGQSVARSVFVVATIYDDKCENPTLHKYD